jgi:diguanylate cyclase (GGDEF)-like protein
VELTVPALRRLFLARRTRLGSWFPLTLLIVLVGVTSSVLLAQSLANSEAKKARDAFRFASHEIASSLKLSISHEEDLIVSTGAHLVTSSAARGPVEFDRWVESAEAMRRFPELQNIGFDLLVPASRLAAFKAHQVKDPIRPFGARGPGAWEAGVLPSEGRSFYCLAAAGIARSPEAYLPVGVDWCALAPTMMYDRDAGAPNYAPITLAGRTALGIATPVYNAASTPRTVAARRRAFLGWLGDLLVPDVVISRALEGQQNIALKFSFSSPTSHVVFAKGAVPKHAMTDTLVVHGAPTRWVLQTFTPGVSSLLLDRPNALLRLLGGVLLTLLASSLILLLATGRRRALAMVAAKTAELAHQATHDPLTGLPNRTLVLDRATQLLARQRRGHELTAALYIDIDGFKEVNDTMGHAAGDELLRTVAERLETTVRAQDTVGRMSGDEFVVLFEANADEPIEALAERLNDVLREPIVLTPDAAPVQVTASIGIACGRYATADELLRDADIALFQAKAAGKDGYVLFDASMSTNAAGGPGLEDDLSGALHEEQFFLLYQPIFELPSRKLVGVEALIRWRHPRRGVVPPNDFIPLAEENGLIVPIGRWVLDEACRQAAVWAGEGRGIGVSVNVSADQLDRQGFADDVRRALQESAIDPALLTLEITETTLMRNVTAACEQLEALRALGVRIAIDDFGTGYASLSHLQRLPVDILKIDMSFVAGLNNESWSRELLKANELLQAILGVSQALSLAVVAEGIERHSQRTALEAMGCQMGQGFLLGKPGHAEAIGRLLDPSSAPSAVGSTLA